MALSKVDPTPTFNFLLHHLLHLRALPHDIQIVVQMLLVALNLRLVEHHVLIVESLVTSDPRLGDEDNQRSRCDEEEESYFDDCESDCDVVAIVRRFPQVDY